jgi:drug/metabolite transporter (DMT)-like permease
MDVIPVAFLWSLAVLAQKQSLSHVKPETAFVVITLTHTVLLLTYLAFNWKTISPDFANVGGKVSLILLAGVFASFIGNLWYYSLLNRMDSSVVSSVISTVPMFVVLLSFLLFRNKITVKQLIGVMTIIVGINFLSK